MVKVVPLYQKNIKKQRVDLVHRVPTNKCDKEVVMRPYINGNAKERRY